MGSQGTARMSRPPKGTQAQAKAQAKARLPHCSVPQEVARVNRSLAIMRRRQKRADGRKGNNSIGTVRGMDNQRLAKVRSEIATKRPRIGGRFVKTSSVLRGHNIQPTAAQHGPPPPATAAPDCGIYTSGALPADDR